MQRRYFKNKFLKSVIISTRNEIPPRHTYTLSDNIIVRGILTKQHAFFSKQSWR